MTDYTPTSHINLAKPFPDVGFGGGNNNGFNKFLILFLIILTILVLF